MKSYSNPNLRTECFSTRQKDLPSDEGFEIENIVYEEHCQQKL